MAAGPGSPTAATPSADARSRREPARPTSGHRSSNAASVSSSHRFDCRGQPPQPGSAPSTDPSRSLSKPSEHVTPLDTVSHTRFSGRLRERVGSDPKSTSSLSDTPSQSLSGFPRLLHGVGVGVGVAVAGVEVGRGVDVARGIGEGVGVGRGAVVAGTVVAVGATVAVGRGVAADGSMVGLGAAEGTGVGVATAVGVGVGVGMGLERGARAGVGASAVGVGVTAGTGARAVGTATGSEGAGVELDAGGGSSPASAGAGAGAGAVPPSKAFDGGVGPPPCAPRAPPLTGWRTTASPRISLPWSAGRPAASSTSPPAAEVSPSAIVPTAAMASATTVWTTGPGDPVAALPAPAAGPRLNDNSRISQFRNR